jgi:hypothetical protein
MVSKFWRLLWSLLVLLVVCSCTTAQEESPLRKFLQHYAAGGSDYHDMKATRYIAAFVHLRDDNTQQVIVYLIGRAWCGTGGCLTLIFLTANAVAGTTWAFGCKGEGFSPATRRASRSTAKNILATRRCHQHNHLLKRSVGNCRAPFCPWRAAIPVSGELIRRQLKRSEPRNAVQLRTRTLDDFIRDFCRRRPDTA